ncbi:MAG: YDG domain-containing protein, partial [Oscillospiraceae bacterium]
DVTVGTGTAQSTVFNVGDFTNTSIWTAPTGNLVANAILPTLVGVNNAQNPTFPKEGKTDISSSIAFTAGTAEYNGSVQTYEKAKYPGDGSFAYTYAATTGKLEGGKPKGAGKYTVTATYTSSTEQGSATANFTIFEKKLTTATVTVGGSYTYTGLPQAPTTVTVKDGNATLIENTDYTFTTTDNTNAGTATVNVTFKNNYSGTAMASFTIAKAPLTVSSGKVTPKAYDGTKTATVTELVFDGLQHSETLASTTDYTVGTATFSDADVGTGKTVTGTATLANTAKANNYTLNGAYTLKNREITKGAYTSPPTKTVNIQNGAKRTGTITLADIFGGNIPTDGAFNRMAASGTVTIMNTVALSGNGINYISNINPVNTKSTDIYIVKVTSKNYVDFVVTITFQAVDKAVVTVSGLTAQDKLVYNGTPQKGYTGNATVKGGNVDVADLVYTYTGIGNTSYNSATAPTNAGSYKLTVAVPSSNADYAGNQSVNFAIAQAPLTITAASYDVYQYKQVPDLSKLKITLIYTGFVNGEGTSVLKGKYTAAYADAGVNTDTPKDYAINVIVASETNKNYGITTKDGKLKVWEAKKDDAPAAKLPNRPITYPTVVAEPASGKTLRLVVASLMTSEQTQTETWLNSNLGTESLREAHEIELQVSSDGTNWSAATIADLLGGKTQAVLSIPKGASPLTHDLFVYHFAKGAGQAATLENAAYNAAANALVVEVTSYSPFVVVAVPKSAGTPVTPPAQPNDTNVIDYENEFWIGVTSKIAAAKKGNTIKIDTGSYNKMPATIMEELRLKGVGMVITSNGEKQITIPAGKAKNAENGRHFWSLSQLAELYKNHTFTEKPNKQNPSTNGYTDTNTGITEPVLGAVVEVTKPQTHQASVIIFVAAAVALGAFVLKRKNEF